MPDNPTPAAKLASHDQPCLSFSHGKPGQPTAAYRREINGKGAVSASRKATLGTDAPSQGGTGLPLLQDAGAFLGTPNAVCCELHSLSFKFVKRTLLGWKPALPFGYTRMGVFGVEENGRTENLRGAPGGRLRFRSWIAQSYPWRTDLFKASRPRRLFKRCMPRPMPVRKTTRNARSPLSLSG